MTDLTNALLKLYIPLFGFMALGWALGRVLPSTASRFFGKALFWVGVPITTVGFLVRSNLSGWIIIAPLVAWLAIGVGAAFAWVWIDLAINEERLKSLSRGLSQGVTTTTTELLQETDWSSPSQGSFLLAMMVGNTGYMGIPVVLGLIGPDYVPWALFYDILGTFIGVYGVGVILAAHYGIDRGVGQVRLRDKMLQNPAMWSLGLGLLLRSFDLPPVVKDGLEQGAWIVVHAALVLIGLQLSRLTSLGKLKQAIPCLGIKMVLVPLVMGTALMFFGITAEPRLAMVLQMGMPPAFATVVFAEVYGLDKDLAVTTIVFGCVALFFLLPIWTLLFGTVT